jgi:hypothetical protein
MSDFKSHLPVQTHKDGADFTPSSDYVVGVGGYESSAGDVLMAAVTASREWLVSNATLESIVYAEDSAHTTADAGAFILAVRNDTLGTLAGTDGDYTPFQVNASGELYVKDSSANTTLTSIDTNITTLAGTVYAEDSAHTTADTGVFVLSVRHDADTSLVDTDGDYAPLQLDANGKLKVNADAVLTNLEKAEDSAHVSGDYGIMALAVRNDAGTVLAGTDGDYIPLTTNAYGALRVTVTDPSASAVEMDDYQTSAAVAVSGTANHDYTVTAGKTLIVNRIWASASGRIKVTVIIDPAGSPATKFVAFNSTANPNIDIPVNGDVEVAAGVVIRVQIENCDEDAQDVYSTILGDEV